MGVGCGGTFPVPMAQTGSYGRRNEVAAGVIEALRRGDRPDFALYLRAFSDDRHKFNRQSERLLARALGERTPLLGLTGEDSPLGTIRVRSTDDKWYEDILLLATNAVVVFVQAPSVTMGEGDFERHSGLMRELRTLNDRGLLGRTALVQSGGLFPNVKHAELIASDGQQRPLRRAAVQEPITTYRRFVGLSPPRPAAGMLLAWQIMFDPDVRRDHTI